MFGNLATFIKKLRNYYLTNIKWKNYEIGSGFHAGVRVRLWAKSQLKIGKNFYIGRDSQIECDAIIGDNVIIANKVGLVGRYDHHYQQIGIPIRLASQIRDPDYNWKGLNQPIIIEDDVWIGYGSILLSGIKIGQGSIIAAGSIVTKDVEPFCIYAGVPARKVANRFNSDEETEEHKRLYELKYKG